MVLPADCGWKGINLSCSINAFEIERWYEKSMKLPVNIKFPTVSYRIPKKNKGKIKSINNTQLAKVQLVEKSIFSLAITGNSLLTRIKDIKRKINKTFEISLREVVTKRNKNPIHTSITEPVMIEVNKFTQVSPSTGRMLDIILQLMKKAMTNENKIII